MDTSMQNFSRHLIAACGLLALGSLVACGGGGSDSPPVNGLGTVVNPPPKPVQGAYSVVAYTFTDLRAYSVVAYTFTDLRVNPPVSTEYNQARQTTNVTDTTYDREYFLSSGTAFQRTHKQGTGERISGLFNKKQTKCTFAPAWNSGPPVNGVVGSDFETWTTETCQRIDGTGTPYTYEHHNKGHIDTLELLYTAVGKVNTYKYTQTTVIESRTPNDPNKTQTISVQSCWVDLITAGMVACDVQTSTQAQGQSTATPISKETYRLVGYALPGQAPVGDVLRRFNGLWAMTVNTPSGVKINCLDVNIDAKGAVSGRCDGLPATPPAAPVGPGVLSISGQVNAAGQATLTLSDGTALSAGTLSSPAQGQSTPAGQWSAKR
jgi:hypothetical protein